jgi:hypothetical protein
MDGIAVLQQGVALGWGGCAAEEFVEEIWRRYRVSGPPRKSTEYVTNKDRRGRDGTWRTTGVGSGEVPGRGGEPSVALTFT